MTITNSAITGNATISNGGGIDVTGCTLTLDPASQVTVNESRAELPDTGGIHVTGTTVTLASSEQRWVRVSWQPERAMESRRSPFASRAWQQETA